MKPWTWLLSRQARIEGQFAGRHLQEGTVVLYDVTSTYFEGQRCPLARSGYSWDERPGHRQSSSGLDPSARLPGGGRGFRG